MRAPAVRPAPSIDFVGDTTLTKVVAETLYEGYRQSFDVKEVLFEAQTDHQHLVIFESVTHGRVMALDGIIQTTEGDEFVYHEMMVHVPLFAHGNAKDVLIIGGGDGGILREVVKHPEVERVVEVEIDGAVIDMCKTYLPKHSDGAYDNPKTEIHVGDGIDYVCTTDRKFDVIISDSTDPMGPGEVLFTSKFYEGVKRCLNPGGIFVAQNGVAFMQIDEVTTTKKRLGAYLADTNFYAAPVPTYIGGIMTLAWGSDNTNARKVDLATIEQRYKTSGIKTRYYNPAIHVAAFALPQYVVEAMEK
jgi:spermidine synthase